jgi:hypothetical protein
MENQKDLTLKFETKIYVILFWQHQYFQHIHVKQIREIWLKYVVVAFIVILIL